MDFLKIRKKAKERAQARAGGDAAAKPPRAEKAGADAPRAAADVPVLTDEDLVEGALAARLQGLPGPGAQAEESDPRFTTWRPGAGAPPPLPLEPEAASHAPVPSEGDFTLLGPSAGRDALRDALPPEPRPTDPLDEFFFRPDEAAPAFPQLAPAEPVAEEQPALLAREEYLTFLLGAEEYAIAIGRVREVIKAPPITDVPRAPAHVLGVVTVRGEVVAVVDPRRRLGLAHPSGAGQRKIVIADAGDGPCGLLVDRVANVVRLPPGSIEPCPQGIAGHRSEFLAGIGRAADRLFTVLDLAALLRPAAVRSPPVARARRPDVGA